MKDTASASATSRQTLASLRQTPVVAGPTLAILIMAVTTIAAVWTLVPLGYWPVWLGTALNAVAGYALFTPTHEAIHRAAARNRRLNEFFLASATFLALPFGKGKLFRLMHMRHHRFANQEDDPDHWLASSMKRMPLWGVWPFVYVVRYLRDPSGISGITRREIIRELLVAALIFGSLLVWIPYYMVMLWLIPTYGAFFLMCLVFMVLPHYPHTSRQDVDPDTTAVMRMGQEWWLTPLLMYQNYHLMHHLYPTIPFYRYGQAWKARQTDHEARSSKVIVGPLGVAPPDL